MKIRLLCVFLFLLVSQIIFTDIKKAKITLADKEMKGAIISLKVFQSINKENINDKELQDAFIENVSIFPIENLEKELMNQNKNLNLIHYKNFEDKLPEPENKQFEILNTSSRMMRNTAGLVSAYGKYNLISNMKLERYSYYHGFTVIEKYSKKTLKSYFDLLDVDIILLVKVNIDSNYQGEMVLSDLWCVYTRPFHSARIMVVALDRNLNLAGYNPDYLFDRKNNVSYLNLYVGSRLDKRKINSNIYESSYFIFEDNAAIELEKMNLFFQELYNDSFVSPQALILEDPMRWENKKNGKHYPIITELDLNLDNNKKGKIFDELAYFKLVF